MNSELSVASVWLKNSNSRIISIPLITFLSTVTKKITNLHTSYDVGNLIFA